MTGASIVITSAPAVDADACFLLGHPAHNKAAAAFITPEAFDAAVPGDEGFMLRNRIPTAEGALRLALEHGGKTLYGASVLVCGMGRIGRYLASALSSLGAHVTVSVRKREDRIKAEQTGFTVILTEKIADCPTAFDFIFNTVPYPILSVRVLKKLRGAPILIDLASKPYGAGFAERRKPKIFRFRID